MISIYKIELKIEPAGENFIMQHGVSNLACYFSLSNSESSINNGSSCPLSNKICFSPFIPILSKIKVYRRWRVNQYKHLSGNFCNTHYLLDKRNPLKVSTFMRIFQGYPKNRDSVEAHRRIISSGTIPISKYNISNVSL